MSERVCQFFLRGRCQRPKCEFRHPADRALSAAGLAASTEKASDDKKINPETNEEVAADVEVDSGKVATEVAATHLITTLISFVQQ